MSEIELTFKVSEAAVMTRGIQDVLREIRLDADGKITIPIDLGGGYRMDKPAPCGTWKRTPEGDSRP